jgi:D-alanine-D-alanine ligase
LRYELGTMKRYRILMITEAALLPSTELADLAKNEECVTEFNVYSSLQNVGHHVRLLGISDQLTELRETIRDWRPHVVFNLMEQFNGMVLYDYHVVAFLELMRQRYTGCNPRGLMLSRDKVLTKQLLAWHRVATPAFQYFPFGKRFHEPRRVVFPLFVKSATEDASLGIAQASIVDDMQSLRERVEFIHEQVQSDAIVEEYIEGREFYVGVLGNGRLTTFPAWEMNFGTLPKVQAGIATRKVKWDRKYQEKHGITTGPAPDLSPAQTEQLSRIAKRIYRALHMNGFARMDFRMRADGSVFLLEANANPNLTRDEDLAESALTVGVGYDDLLMRIVNLGLGYMPEWRMFEA